MSESQETLERHANELHSKVIALDDRISQLESDLAGAKSQRIGFARDRDSVVAFLVSNADGEVQERAQTYKDTWS